MCLGSTHLVKHDGRDLCACRLHTGALELLAACGRTHKLEAIRERSVAHLRKAWFQSVTYASMPRSC